MDERKYKAWLLYKLARKNRWNNKHTSIDNLHKGCPGHLKGMLKDLAEELIKEEFIQTKKTSYGTEISLNSRKKAEIEVYIRNHLDG